MKKIIALVIAALCLMSILPVSTLAASTYVVYIRFAFMKSANATVYSNLYYVSGSSSYTAKTSSTGTTMYSNAPQTFTVPSGYTCTKNSYTGSSGDIAWKISRSSSFTAKDALPTNMSDLGSIADGYELAGTYYATSAADVRAAQITKATTWSAVRANAASANAISSYSSNRYFYICLKPSTSASTPAPEATATPAPTPAATATPIPNADCKLKVWASTPGADDGSPTYNAPYTTMIRSGQGYTWLEPEAYGIKVSEGYEINYYYDNAQRQVGSTSYVSSNLQGWSAVAYFKQKAIAAKTITLEYALEDGTVVATASKAVAAGNYWDKITVYGEAELTASGADYELISTDGQEFALGKLPNKVTFKVKAPDPIPPVVVEGVTITLSEEIDAATISNFWVAPGEYTTVNDMRTAAGRVSVTGKTGWKFTANDLRNATDYTIYIKFNDGTPESWTYATLVPTPPTVAVKNGDTIAVTVNDDFVAEMHVARGIYTTAAEVKAGANYRNVSDTHEYAAVLSTEMETYTYYIVMQDGSTYLDYVDVEATLDAEPRVTVNGASFTLNQEVVDPSTISGMWAAQGKYYSYSALKAGTGFKNITSTLKYTANGLVNATDCTIYYTFTDGSVAWEYVTLVPTPPKVAITDGKLLIGVTVNEDSVKSMWVAHGEYTTYSQMAASNDNFRNVSSKHEYKALISNTTERYTYYIIMQDGSYYLGYIDVEPIAEPDPEVTWEGFTVTASDESVDFITAMYVSQGTFEANEYTAMRDNGVGFKNITNTKSYTFTDITADTAVTVFVKTYKGDFVFHKTLQPIRIEVKVDGNAIYIDDGAEYVTFMAVGFGHHESYGALRVAPGFAGCTKTLRYTATQGPGEYTVRIATTDGNMQFIYVNVA